MTSRRLNRVVNIADLRELAHRRLPPVVSIILMVALTEKSL